MCLSLNLEMYRFLMLYLNDIYVFHYIIKKLLLEKQTAENNLSCRFLQHSGFYPDYTEEASALAAGRPNVENVTLLLKDWWGSGIVHAKVWISDSRDVYIGSANNDWKSLTQVP